MTKVSQFDFSEKSTHFLENRNDVFTGQNEQIPSECSLTAPQAVT